MKKYYTLLILLLSFWSHAQNGITYQALILNPNSEELPGVDNSRLPLVNQNVTLEFKILNAKFLLDYQETINTQTDAYGMVNVVIGTGTRKAGIATQFSGINWDGSAKTLIVSLDPSGESTHFIEISNQPFTYVPFALYAAHTGVAGTQGPAGNNGLDGKTVLNGTTNPIASLGTNGDFYINTASSSLFGPKTNDIWGNSVSLVGPQGIQGATGLQGTAGTNGTNGSNGNDGLSAYQIWLNAGNTGTEVQFLTALRGATGAQGPQGIQGLQGPTGLTGATGSQGIAGTNGTNGLSAYQIWLNAGNTGTEAQFLAALLGATGAQGIQGATGTQGTNGLDGKTVLNGTQNPTASTGNNGDFYINTTTNSLFGPKTSGAWGSGIALVGPQGATGTNGKNSLINTTIEAAGANCANGGTKIEVGLDANSNGILDSGEVNNSLTKYICNGVSSNNTGGSSNLVHGMVTLNTIGQSINWVIPNDVYTIEIHVNGSNGGKGGDALYVGCGGIEKYGGTGGVYGSAKVNLNVVPGDVITYYLGLNGTPGNDACNYGYGAIAMNGTAGETTLIYKNSILGMRIVSGNGGGRAVSGGNGSAGSNGYLDMSGLLNNGFFAEEKVNPYSNQKQTIIIRY